MTDRLYRTDYEGEFVITKTVFRAGKKDQTREWIENPISNESANHRACCVGTDTGNFPLNRLEHHNGGLLQRGKMQLYSVKDTWTKMNADFTVVLDQVELDKIVEANYQKDNVVYTSTSLCINNPGEFYLVPHGAIRLPETTAVWLACFDGHKDIYLFGYDTVSDESAKVIDGVRNVMQTYYDVQFYHVTDANTPDAWLRCANLKVIGTRDFVSECDI